MSASLEQLITVAIAEGLLPASASQVEEDARPWPVLLLTALGGWLAALPLVFLVFTLFDGILNKHDAPLIVGIPTVLVSLALLRSRRLPHFFEEMLMPAFLAGSAVTAYGLFDQLPQQGAAAVCAVAACAAAVVVPRTWLRLLLGVAACGMTIAAFLPPHATDRGWQVWLALHGGLAIWAAVEWRMRSALLQSLTAGWCGTLIAGLAIYAGMTFLLGAQVDGAGRSFGTVDRSAWDSTIRAGSALMTLAAAVRVAIGWPSLRRIWCVLSVLVLAALAWLMPSLGACLFILAVNASNGRWRMATAGALGAAWIIGAFYYHLAYPLQTKAVWMIGAGIVLAVIARYAMGTATAKRAPTPNARARNVAIACCALATLAIANAGIWQKEGLIANGRPLFVELAPVDPRSLMQGDYMRLRFRMPPDLAIERTYKRPYAVGRIDARGVVTLLRLDQGSPLAPDEISVELTKCAGGWSLASDSWSFAEGDGARWARAKYGELRVDAKGHALLVGMRGPALEPL